MKYLLYLSIHFSDTNDSKIDGNVPPDLEETRKESVQELRQNKLDNDEQMHAKVGECEAGSSNKTPILRINSTSHTIHKLKKNKKTLNII